MRWVSSATVKDGLILSMLSAVPRSRMSRIMGAGARLYRPQWLQRVVMRWYVGRYGVNLDECVGGLEDYPTLAELFIRRLRPGVRPVAEEADAVVSPADGVIYAAGRVKGGRLPQAPELDYAVRTLLDGDDRYEGGDFAVIYLSPKDYHRVHSPREGRVLGHRYLPGRLWPVFPAATRRIRDLFARNERLVIRLDTDTAGEIAVVMVGAFGVGRMAVEFADLVTNTGAPGADVQLPEPHLVGRGGELGRFELGSTVVLLTQPGKVEFEVSRGQQVRMGARIGRVLA
jgi:phosphatidylserine decarboxylase